MFITFLLFQNIHFYYFKGFENSVHKDLFKTKNPKQKTPRPFRPSA